MKETSSGIICGHCKKSFLENSNFHNCRINGNYSGILVDNKYVKGCPFCFSSIVVFSCNSGANGHTIINLCQNPNCFSYIVVKESENLPFYQIYCEDRHLASFTIRKNKKAGFVWNLLGYKLFHKIVNSVAKEFIKEESL